MYVPGIPLSRSIAWGVHGRQFRFTMAGEQLILESSDGRLSLSRHEWQGVAAALAVLHPPAPLRGGDEGTTSSRRPWRDSDDAALADGWYGDHGLSALAGLVGRTPAAVAARLVRLDIVGDRAEALRRP